MEETETMASSSLVPSSLPPNMKHHVFPSFHGPDVRRSLLSHIVKEFRRKQIDLFIDNNIERSKSIGPELIEAIRGSRIAIVLLSKNYASSTWCLDELVEIIRCKEVLHQIVMVIFYEVDPTDVKKQTGEFGEVFRKTCQGKTKEAIGRWKQALEEVAKIASYHSRNWDNEAKMIEKIAIDVSNKLNLSTPSRDFDGFVGMESHMINMGPLLRLDLEEVRMVGIWGPCGIGKTTIARFLYNLYSKDFQLCVFMHNIKVVPACSDDYSVKLDLQKQFMSEIINDEGSNVPHLGIVQDRLKDKKVLVVLDDVRQLGQLEAMVKETSWFGDGSRIIITTQNRKILQEHGVNYIHKVDFPSSNVAFQMFCMYAFKQKFPKDGFEMLAWEVTVLARELPLGLRILGSYFRGMSAQDWTTALPSLRTRLNGEIESILKYSYDALCDEYKKLFLHIACFFNYESVDVFKGCLANSFSDSFSVVTEGLRVLTEKSLISVECEWIVMHKLLVQLGREIVRKQSIDEPGKRQFLVSAKDIGEVLNDDKANCSKVLGLLMPYELDMGILYEGLTRKRALERFCNLRFLRVDERYGTIRMPCFLRNLKVYPELRYLSWHDFRMRCFPSRFQTKFLVKLLISYGNLEKLWEGIQPLSNLKWMSLCHLRRLKELPDLSTAINLCELDLTECSSLVKLPSSMKNLCKLSNLYLGECSSLEVNLTNINLESLERLHIAQCFSLKCYQETSTTIEDLKPNGTSTKEKVSSSMRPLSNSHIQELDPWKGRVSRLRHLILNYMWNIVSLPQLPYSVTELNASYCKSLERLECSFSNPDIHLNFGMCHKLNHKARDLIIHTRTNGYAVLPGGEVPECFTYRASGSSLTVKLSHTPLGTSTKFKACLATEKGYPCTYGKKEKVDCYIKSRQNDVIYTHQSTLKLFPEHLCIFEFEVEVTSTELYFEFVPLNDDKSYTWKIKECGVMQLLEVPSCDEQNNKRFRDGGEDSDMERQILKKSRKRKRCSKLDRIIWRIRARKKKNKQTPELRWLHLQLPVGQILPGI